jgi:putative nucleotidyltransferase with HDIG domain
MELDILFHFCRSDATKVSLMKNKPVQRTAAPWGGSRYPSVPEEGPEDRIWALETAIRKPTVGHLAVSFGSPRVGSDEPPLDFGAAGLAPDRVFSVRGFKHDFAEALSRAADVEEDFPGHARVVARYALLLAHTLGLTDEFFLRELERGAHLHDIGKAGIPRSILCKSGPLTPLEWEIIRDHPLIGFRMARDLGVSRLAAQVILHHHEQYDGRGYPFGLQGQNIPLAARIFSLADALDAITSDRPYRPRGGLDRARAEISRQQGLKFDPEIVVAFLSIGDELWLKASRPPARAIRPRVMEN